MLSQHFPHLGHELRRGVMCSDAVRHGGRDGLPDEARGHVTNSLRSTKPGCTSGSGPRSRPEL
eukprot:1840175-Pyramimonas_sp.AAC.1